MKRFQNIIYFADGALEVDPALQRAFRLAESNHARLTLLDVIEPIDLPGDLAQRFNLDLASMLIKQRQEELEALGESLRGADCLIYTKVLTGTPFIEVIKAVSQSGYDLVIKSARPAGSFSDRLLGSTDLHLLRKCPCPVWVDRPGGESHYSKILAAVDPMAPAQDNCARLVMDLATSLAQRESATLGVIHAWHLHGESLLRDGRFRMPPDELERLLAATETKHRARLAELLSGYGMTLYEEGIFLLKTEAASAIRETAEQFQADLIVMGTVGRSGIPGLFIGNTAESVLQTTRSSILAVKPPAFVSPVR
ncbi:MAG: universal stress protein [Candidatus Thiodiazotropha sp.]